LTAMISVTLSSKQLTFEKHSVKASEWIFEHMLIAASLAASDVQ